MSPCAWGLCPTLDFHGDVGAGLWLPRGISIAREELRPELNGLATFSNTAAQSLARHDGRWELNGLAEFSDKAAESLAKHDGHLMFGGLVSLPEIQDKAFSEHRGRLAFYGLTSLFERSCSSPACDDRHHAVRSVSPSDRTPRRRCPRLRNGGRRAPAQARNCEKAMIFGFFHRHIFSTSRIFALPATVFASPRSATVVRFSAN